MVTRTLIKNKKKLPKRLSKWDLYRDGVSFSILSKFVIDRERCRIRNVLGLIHDTGTESLDFGTAFHKLTQYHAMGESLALLKRRVTKNSKDTLLGEMAFEVFKQYAITWKKDDRKKKYIDSERKFRVPIKLPCGREVHLQGKYDEVFLENGQLWLQENKTKSQIDEYGIEHGLSQDLQTMLYACTMEHMYGRRVHGVLYNVIRKPLLRQRKKETSVNFLKRIREDIEKRPEWYFIRWRTEITKQDLDNFKKKTLYPLLTQMCLWWESIRHNPFDPWTLPDGSVNPHHFLRPVGVYDPFKFGKGEYFDYITRGVRIGLKEIDTAFPELQDDPEEEQDGESNTKPKKEKGKKRVAVPDTRTRRKKRAA